MPNSFQQSDSRLIPAIAAMFHGEFRLEWIVTLSQHEYTSVLRIMKKLANSGTLINTQPGFYRFINDEERQGVLDLLSFEEKNNLNLRIISLMEAEPLNNDEKATILYPHLLEIQLDLIGCGWLKRAGDVFRRRFQFELARTCYEKVIETLSSLHGTTADLLFIEAAVSHSKVFMGAKETSTIINILENASERSNNRKEFHGLTALVKMELAKNEWLRSRYHIAMKHFQEGQVIAQRTGDEHILRKTALYNIYYYFWQGRIKDIISEYENYQPEVAAFPKNRFLLRTIGLAAEAYSHAGQMNQALGIVESLEHYAEGIGDNHTRCHAQAVLSVIMGNMGRIEEAFKFCRHCLELCEWTHARWLKYHAKLGEAHLYYLKGNHDQAIASLREFDLMRKHTQVYAPVLPLTLLDICWAIESGNLQYSGSFTFNQILQQALEGENIFTKGIAYRYKAFLKERQKAPTTEILRNFIFSIKLLEAAGAQVEMAKSQIELARRQLQIDDVNGAREMTLKASRILVEINPDLIPKNLRLLVDEKKSKRDNVLNEILKLGQDIANIKESKFLLLKIISVINNLTNAERGAIFILDDGELKFKTSQNLTQSQTQDPQFTESMNVIKEVVRKGRECIKEVNADYPMVSFIHDMIVRFIICVPMVLRGQVVGALYHDKCLSSSSFEQTDLELLTYFASLAALSFENVSSYDNQSLNQKLSQEKEYFEEQYLNRVHWGNIIGKSPGTNKVLNEISRVAQMESTVLILGETGTGKELVAHAIHQNSLRRDKPHIVVQCSALPESLIQSELFGHEKGAFTGALKRKLGRIELADDGTLFLDEIGDLSLDVQVRLLRVLQTKRFERVGGNETLQSDFRLIAATNRNLDQAVREGKFRADLYYRINVFPIHVPPLRERKEDIPLLASHFLSVHSKKLRKDFRKIHEKALSSLMNYDWPGNIRELENTLERAMILDQPPLLRNVDLPQVERQNKETSTKDLEISLDENERRHIIDVLNKTGWQISGELGAAKILKINPSTLRFRIHKLGIQKHLL